MHGSISVVLAAFAPSGYGGTKVNKSNLQGPAKVALSDLLALEEAYIEDIFCFSVAVAALVRNWGEKL